VRERVAAVQSIGVATRTSKGCPDDVATGFGSFCSFVFLFVTSTKVLGAVLVTVLAGMTSVGDVPLLMLWSSVVQIQVVCSSEKTIWIRDELEVVE